MLMFHSFKVKGLRLTVFSLLCLLLFVGVCLLALRAGGRDTVTVGGERYSLRVADTRDVAAFLAVCGYDVAEPLSEQEVTVPKTWNDTYDRYNRLQLSQGLDLVPYKGRVAQELIYAAGERFITVLLSGDRIIAAHISVMDGSSQYEPLITP